MAVVPVPVTDASACETSQQTQTNPPQTKVPDNQVIDLTADTGDDIQKAIAASLQDQPGILGGQVTKEEQDISRILEASLVDSKVGTKRKRGELWFVDPLNPHERKRQDGWPVGLKNVGNTCWFSAVIQSLFHLPVFRHLVLNFVPLADISQGPSHSEGTRNLKFMQELRKLFALLVGSKRKYVDPSKPVEILKEAFTGSNGAHNAQQDVSEFQHKLLEWLEDAFKTTYSGASSPAAGDSCKGETADGHLSKNPMVQLFYGQVLSEGTNEGNSFCNKETFGQFPLQVEGNRDIHESLERAMVIGEIEGINNEAKASSGQEQWFTRLPPVLTFELSRFQFNQQLGRPEKIHDQLKFPASIFMDRYMESNKNTTRLSREEVRRLNLQLQFLHSKLDKYINYGSGPMSKRVPLQDVLRYALEFAESKPATPSTSLTQDVEMESPKSQSDMVLSPGVSPNKCQCPADVPMMEATPSRLLTPSTSHTPAKKLAPALGGETAPREVSDEELHVLQSCLHRWRTEVESDVKELQDSINQLEKQVSTMYGEEDMKNLQYQLHAVLVHEGQAASGHYWAYVYSKGHEKWLKFNDITVTDSSWEDLEKESFGGYHNASAYCLMYIDPTRSDLLRGIIDTAEGSHELDISKLPPDLAQVVNEDNAKFDKEILEWDQEQLRKQQPVASTSVDPDVTITAEGPVQVKPVTPPIGASASLKPHVGGSPYAADHASLSATHTYKVVMEAAEEAEQMKKKPNEALMELCDRELKSFEKDAAKMAGSLVSDDGRIRNILIFLLANKAPSHHVINRVAWEQFTLLQELDNNQSSRLMRHTAIQKLEQIKNTLPDYMENAYIRWHEDYHKFRETAREFATGVKLFHSQKFREALPLFDSACERNSELLNRKTSEQLPKKSQLMGLDKIVLLYYRRQCMLHLNKLAVSQFEISEDIDDVFSVMNSVVLPCLLDMSSSDSEADQAAVEEMRDKWCNLLGNGELCGEKAEKLEDFFAKLFELPPDVRIGRSNKVFLPPGLVHELIPLYKEAVDLVKKHKMLDAAYLDS